MFWPCNAAIGSVDIATSMRDLLVIKSPGYSERERVLFGDHDEGSPTRRDLRRMGQSLLASGRLRALLERLHRWKVNLRDAVELRIALRRLQNLRGDHFGLSVEICYRHRYVLLLINLLESRG